MTDELINTLSLTSMTQVTDEHNEDDLKALVGLIGDAVNTADVAGSVSAFIGEYDEYENYTRPLKKTWSAAGDIVVAVVVRVPSYAQEIGEPVALIAEKVNTETAERVRLAVIATAEAELAQAEAKRVELQKRLAELRSV